MNIQEARAILGLKPEDTSSAVKRKFRRLMAQHHPDMAGEAQEAYTRKAQQLNEAYAYVKTYMQTEAAKNNMDAGEELLRTEVNDACFCERNVYAYDFMGLVSHGNYHKIGRGRYMWNCDTEEFDLFLTSIHEAVKQLMESVEEAHGFGALLPQAYQKEQFRCKAALFGALAAQYIHPYKTLKRLKEPEYTDANGRDVYVLQAELICKEKALLAAFEQLHEGDLLFAHSFQNRQIRVKDDAGHVLGTLSFAEDELYFCILPLLRAHAAQMKLEIREKIAGGRPHAYLCKLNVNFYLRMENTAYVHNTGSQNIKIAEWLSAYEQLLSC